MRRRFLALTAALLALAPPALALLAPPARLSVTPVPLDPADRGRTRVGGLTYLGGWVLRSQDRRFGGISSMSFQDGALVALSDGGILFRLTLARGTVALGDIRELPDGPGSRLSKIDRDSESSAFDPASGRTWVGFETSNAIWRYAPGFAAAEAHAQPKEMSKWPPNLGAEALARLRDGRFLIFAETGATRHDGANPALLYAGDPTAPGAVPLRFGYRAPKGFAITDATELPDGRVLVLHRRVSLMNGIDAALTVFDPRAIAPGAVISGREIARLTSPVTVDNMEALAVTQEGGRIVVWIASDDNYSPIQRTLLLRFALDPGV